ncbi:hypothetical protein L6R46_15475 [Myxococcota bacterium]|nr:hypothetical protein [Myxococcota bacterium]
MRDDIHRSAPVSKDWKKVIKLCLTEAEARFEAPKALETALAKDLAAQITPQGIRALKEMASSSQLSLPGYQWDVGVSHNLTIVETEAARYIEAVKPRSCSAEEAIAKAWDSFVQSNIDNKVRIHAQTVLSVSDSKTFIGRWNTLDLGRRATVLGRSLLDAGAGRTYGQAAAIDLHNDDIRGMALCRE